MDRNSTVKKLLGPFLGLVTLVACLLILYVTLDGHWDAAMGALTPVVILIAIGAIGIHAWANSLLATQWGRMLLALGVHLPRRLVAWLWTRAQLTRYAIGSAGLVSRPVLAKAHGVPLEVGTSTTLLESVWLMAILGMGLPFAASFLDQLSAAVWLVGVGCWLVVIGLSLCPGFVLSPLQRLRPNLVTKGLDGHGLVITGGYLFQLLGRALAFIALAAGINSGTIHQWPILLGAFVISYLVGWLFIFSPGGLGPREAVASVMLVQAGLNGGQVVALVALARVVEVLGELVYVARIQKPGMHEPPPVSEELSQNETSPEPAS